MEGVSTQTGYEIVRITSADTDYVRQVSLLSVEFYSRSIYEDAKMNFSAEKFELWLHAMIDDHDAYLLAAVRNGVVLGYTLFYFEAQYCDNLNCEIMTIYTSKPALGLGIGRALVNETMKIIDASAARLAQVTICSGIEDEGNISALTANMYRKHGFEDLGIVMAKRIGVLNG